MKKSPYQTLTQGRERLLKTLFLLDEDVKQWQNMQKALLPQASTKPLAGDDALNEEFALFFSSSSKIRKRLTDTLELIYVVAEN